MNLEDRLRAKILQLMNRLEEKESEIETLRSQVEKNPHQRIAEMQIEMRVLRSQSENWQRKYERCRGRLYMTLKNKS